MARSGLLHDHASVLDIKDHERALYWKDGRFESILGPGIHVIWNKPFEINIEVVDTTGAFFSAYWPSATLPGAFFNDR